MAPDGGIIPVIMLVLYAGQEQLFNSPKPLHNRRTFSKESFQCKIY
jgi:hypothetical protein